MSWPRSANRGNETRQLETIVNKPRTNPDEKSTAVNVTVKARNGFNNLKNQVIGASQLDTTYDQLMLIVTEFCQNHITELGELRRTLDKLNRIGKKVHSRREVRG